LKVVAKEMGAGSIITYNMMAVRALVILARISRLSFSALRASIPSIKWAVIFTTITRESLRSLMLEINDWAGAPAGAASATLIVPFADVIIVLM